MIPGHNDSRSSYSVQGSNILFLALCEKGYLSRQATDLIKQDSSHVLTAFQNTMSASSLNKYGVLYHDITSSQLSFAFSIPTFLYSLLGLHLVRTAPLSLSLLLKFRKKILGPVLFVLLYYMYSVYRMIPCDSGQNPE